MLLYVVALVTVSTIFFSHALPLIFIAFRLVEVIGFFYFSNLLTKKWANYSPKRFRKNLFYTAFFIRLAWVIFSYFFYIEMYGKPFEFEAGDSNYYNYAGTWIHSLIINGQGLKPFMDSLKGGYSDAGYSIYLGFQYFIWDFTF